MKNLKVTNKERICLHNFVDEDLSKFQQQSLEHHHIT